MKYSIVEAGERSWLLGPQHAAPKADDADDPFAPTARQRDNESDCNVCDALAKIALCALLLVGSFVGLYLINQQLISAYGPLEETVRVTDTFDLVHRDVWRADERIARGRPTLLVGAPVPPHRVLLVFHTRGPQCTQFRECVQLMRDMQIASNVSTGADILFNFLIGGDGQTYEARGWWHQSGVLDVPASLLAANGVSNATNPGASLTVAFIGDYSARAPSEAQLRQAETLLGEAVQRGRLTPDYRAYGVRYLAEAADNGDALWAELARRWAHWAAVISVE